MSLPLAPLLLLVLAGPPVQTPDRPVWNFEIGERLPSFELERLEGGRGSVPVPGEIAVLNVFATWCGPCRMEMPLLRCDIQDRYAGEGLQVYGIDRGEAGPLVARFIGWLGIDYPILLDSDRRFFSAISGDGAGIPKTILVDREGRVAWLENGFRPGVTIGELVDAIEGLLSSNPGSAGAKPAGGFENR